PPPSREEWVFLNDLKRRETVHVLWLRDKKHRNELDLRNGFRLVNSFGDETALDTAYQDWKRFCKELKLKACQGGVPLTLRREALPEGEESHRLTVSAQGIELVAGDAEGMRRAIYLLEDRITAQDGPFLPFSSQTRKPWLRNRISRCFFGPIKRPPFNRDELMDDMDYYPDEYLNRLAHEGVNGLWLTIVFRELAETSFTRRDPDAPRRLAKLRRTIAQCLRYGIKTWLFSIEPRWLPDDDPLLLAHPELGGALGWNGQHCFCTQTATGQQYLYESTKDIFTQLPGLGGLINISHGERMTSCLSASSALEPHRPNCPHCSQVPHWKIHYDTCEAMVRGMREANPKAEMISWLYQPHVASTRDSWVYELARHLPEGVTLQYNFESGSLKRQLGRMRQGGDYWLSHIGPSEIFRRIADNAREAHVPLSAKIQVGNSHEVATVPFVP
ncbi:MAG: hypothetical protein IJJ33_02895, partial [Victivallales bacterium]|nr:hypothetical protein [Victivallales bacterium]